MSRGGEAEIERVLQACLEYLDEQDGGELTEWEQEFLENLEEQNAAGHLTPRQVDKLMQIYTEKVQK